MSEMHIGRSWSGNALEWDCPCPKAQCGLVIASSVDIHCPEHSWHHAKTIRQAHSAEDCPGVLR